MILCLYFNAVTFGFAPRIEHHHLGRSRTTSTSRINGTIEFQGESTTSIQVPLPNTAKSLDQWMLSEESDRFFLGTLDYRMRDDGRYDAFQPSVDWFGLELVPVFVIQLERDQTENQVAAMITEARNDIKAGKDSATGRLVSRVMGGSTFKGGNTVVWQETTNGWTVQADISLTLSIKLPPFLPLPPGFNRIGSRIVKSTCKSRLEKFIVSLQEAYLEWAEEL